MVFMADGSLPACGSESAKAPATASPDTSRVTWRRFCSSLPKRTMTSATMLVTAIATATDASAAAISSMASE